MKKISLLFFFAFIFFETSAVTGFTPVLEKAYTYLFKLKLDSTQILVNRNARLSPDNQINTLLYCYVECIRMLLSEDPLVFTQWQNRFDARINAVKTLSKSDPYRNYILGEIYLQSGLVKAKFNDQMSALLDFRKGYSYLADNEKEFPEFIHHKKSLGFIHVLLSLVPKQYQWVVNLAGFKTDLKLGENQLSQAVNGKIAISDEALFFQIWLNVVQNEDNYLSALASLRDFAAAHPDYVVAKWSMVMLLKNIHQTQEALVMANQIIPNSGHYYSPYFYFVKGQMNLNMGNLELANEEMKNFLANYKGVVLKQSAYFSLYLSDYLVHKTENLNQYKDSVLKESNSNSELDYLAQRAIKNNPHPNREILSAKLQYDAGLFDQSLQTLAAISPDTISNQSEKVEYFYRKASGLEKLRQIPLAFENYQLAIQYQNKMPLYFAPNALLRMGKLVQKENPDLAKSYLKKIEDYDKYEYQSEVEYKAKALLKKIQAKPDK